MNTPIVDTQALPPGTRLEEFVIERVLGSGGFGITYLAADTSLGRKVVIKENLPAHFAWRETATGTVRPRHSSASDARDYEWSMRNFLREAETLASLDHPGIVRVLRQFAANGTAYFVMPFLEGVSLDRLIDDRSARNKPFSQDELLGLASRMLEALAYLHDHAILHRDIKPGNILITNQGLPVLIDFGSARQQLSDRSMTVIESAGYTPFEQLQSRGEVGPWSDLYALGATLTKTITFETPPKSADRMMGDPWLGLAVAPWDTVYADWFLQSIDRAMAVDPVRRWQDAREWAGFLNGGSSPAGIRSVTRLPARADAPAAPSAPAVLSPPLSPNAWIAARPSSSTGSAASMQSLPSDIPSNVPQVRPWVRFWARIIDNLLFSFVAGLLLAIVIPGLLDLPTAGFNILFLFLYNFMEPAWFKWLGTTPGKALLGITLRKSNGAMLGYHDALVRVFNVWFRALALGIPIVNLFTQLHAYNKLSKNGVTSWDRDAGIQVIHHRVGPMRVLAVIAIFFVIVLLVAAGDAAWS